MPLLRWRRRYRAPARTEGELAIIPVTGLPEIHPGDDLPAMVLASLTRAGRDLRDHDVVVFAQKVVSKSEDRLVRLADVIPGARATRMAAESGRDPRHLEVVLSETREIVRWERGVLIAETHHGFICANAGVDHSNAGAPDTLVLLPTDPDASAARLRAAFFDRTELDVGVVITDTFGRPWRQGHANVAIGVAGLPPLERYAGKHDSEGYELRVTEIALADEIAAASEIVMGKLDRRPVAIVRGLRYAMSDENAQSYVRPADKDMFR